jgi:hypothetical protein
MITLRPVMPDQNDDRRCWIQVCMGCDCFGLLHALINAYLNPLTGRHIIGYPAPANDVERQND